MVNENIHKAGLSEYLRRFCEIVRTPDLKLGPVTPVLDVNKVPEYYVLYCSSWSTAGAGYATFNLSNFNVGAALPPRRKFLVNAVRFICANAVMEVLDVYGRYYGTPSGTWCPIYTQTAAAILDYYFLGARPVIGFDPFESLLVGTNAASGAGSAVLWVELV